MGNRWYKNMIHPVPQFKNGHRVQRFFFDKVNKNFFMNKMTCEEKIILDGKLYAEYKFDTVNTPYVFIINHPVAPQWYPIEGKFDLTFEPKANFGFHVIYLAAHGSITHFKGDHDVTVINNGDKFEAKEVSKQIMREHSLLYTMHCTLAYPLPCPKQVDVVSKIFVEIIKHAETLLLVDATFNANVIKGDLKTKLYIPTGSMFCSTGSEFAGCYNKWDGNFKVHVDLKNKNVYLNKFSVDACIKKNNECQFKYELNTRVSPYVMKMNAPSVLPMIFDDPRRHTLEVTVEHKEGQMLHVITNAPEVSNFKVTSNGVQRVLELNGEQLAVVDYTKADKKFKQVLQLPNGEHVTVSLDWATWNAKNNKVNMHIETATRKFNVNMDYDITNIKAGKMMVKFHGENPLLGKFELMRNGNWKVDANQIDAQWTGHATFAKGPLAMFAPIDTTSTINYNFAKMVRRGNIAKTIAGQKWGVNMSENKFNLISGKP